MAKWVKIHGDRFWRTSIIVDVEKILQINLYEAIKEMDIIYPSRFFPIARTFRITYKKDSEYNYFKDLNSI
jgi:hypothetical protein